VSQEDSDRNRNKVLVDFVPGSKESELLTVQYGTWSPRTLEVVRLGFLGIQQYSTTYVLDVIMYCDIDTMYTWKLKTCLFPLAAPIRELSVP